MKNNFYVFGKAAFVAGFLGICNHAEANPNGDQLIQKCAHEVMQPVRDPHLADTRIVADIDDYLNSSLTGYKGINILVGKFGGPQTEAQFFECKITAPPNPIRTENGRARIEGRENSMPLRSQYIHTALLRLPGAETPFAALRLLLMPIESSSRYRFDLLKLVWSGPNLTSANLPLIRLNDFENWGADRKDNITCQKVARDDRRILTQIGYGILRAPLKIQAIATQEFSQRSSLSPKTEEVIASIHSFANQCKNIPELKSVLKDCRNESGVVRVPILEQCPSTRSGSTRVEWRSNGEALEMPAADPADNVPAI